MVTGEKRIEIPPTLKWVHLAIAVTSDVNENQVIKSVELASKYCSIHETISKVTVMSHEVRFIKPEA